MSSSSGQPLARSNHVRQRSHPQSTGLSKQVSAPAMERTTSQSSNSSTSSHLTARSSARPSPSPYSQRNDSPATMSATSLASTLKIPPRQSSYVLPPRIHSPIGGAADAQRHRARQHSQGFFEPSLPTASHGPLPSTSNLTASAIAAQAAMQVQGNPHARRRSQTVHDPLAVNQPVTKRNPSFTSSGQSSNGDSRASSQTRFNTYSNTSAAATAANAAYPSRSPIPSPTMQQSQQFESIIPQSAFEKDQKPGKEKSRMKIFSKPKAINVTGHKDLDKKVMPSPKKPVSFASSTFPRSMNQSTTSLVDPSISSASSIYSIPNSSTSTLVPSDSRGTVEKEKHRHHFLSRQKNKLKDTVEQHGLSLSSAASNSKITDPNTQPLYSFVPASPAHSTSFNRSKTGLDLRHGGRALREKKREEKAAAGTFVPPVAPGMSTPIEATFRDRDAQNGGTPEWPTPGSNFFGPSSSGSTFIPETAFLQQGLGAFGLPGMTVDDAWPLLKARLLNIFEGEDIRTPIEDFNRLVVAHMQRCLQQQTPSLVLQDLRELLNTGFRSLDHTLRRVPDHRLVPHLVDMWAFVFGTIVPFVQAAFYPLDLELKGRGSIFSTKELTELRNSVPTVSVSYTRDGPTQNQASSYHTKSSSNGTSVVDFPDMRVFTLMSFRDNIILPRHDALLSIFSRLSLDNINAVPMDRLESPPPLRPGTATSIGSSGAPDLPSTSFTSQGSTLLDSSTAGSLGARSRATSNTSAMSAGSFHSIASSRPHASSHGSNTSVARSQAQQQAQSGAPPQPILDSTQVTQTAARMLQCISVLAGLQSPGWNAPRGSEGEAIDGTEDEETLARKKMQRLGKELKLNWLGRGRTGRNRRGLVGGKIRTLPVGVAA